VPSCSRFREGTALTQRQYSGYKDDRLTQVGCNSKPAPCGESPPHKSEGWDAATSATVQERIPAGCPKIASHMGSDPPTGSEQTGKTGLHGLRRCSRSPLYLERPTVPRTLGSIRRAIGAFRSEMNRHDGHDPTRNGYLRQARREAGPGKQVPWPARPRPG
jgi:hypothetical protein